MELIVLKFQEITYEIYSFGSSEAYNISGNNFCRGLLCPKITLEAQKL